MITKDFLMKYIRTDIPGRFNELDMLKKEWYRILCLFQGNIVPPYEVIIQPSSNCNLRCIWCIGTQITKIEKNKNIRFITNSLKLSHNKLQNTLRAPRIMEKIIKEIIDYKKRCRFKVNGAERELEFKIENVTFSGLTGEPLVAKASVISAMQLLVAKGIRTGIYTNAELMDESTLPTIVKCAYVNISFDTSTAKSYSRLKCGSGDNDITRFNKVIKNIKNLERMKNKTLGANCEINASFVLYPTNYLEVYNAAVILKNLGCRFFRIKQDISMKHLLNDQQKNEAQRLLDKIKDELEDSYFKLILIHPLQDMHEMVRQFSECIMVNLMATVASDGNLYPCNYHPRPNGFAYGSTVNRSFREIWEGVKRSEINNRIFHCCPPVCDPFKNRANRLLNVVKMAYLSKNISEIQSYIEKINVPCG